MRLRNISIIALIITSICFFSACNPIIIEGIDEFSQGTSSMGLTKYLLPDSDFLSRFNYLDSCYYYYDNDRFDEDSMEKVFMMLTYDDKTYLDGKEYCLSTMKLSSSNIKELGQYVWIENLSLPDAYDHLTHDINTEFPYFFNMIGYNDEENTLVFIGFRCEKAHYDAANSANTDFAAFLKEFYGDYYQFAA